MNPLACIDHTLLRPETTGAQIVQLCEEAVEHGFAAVCVPPVFVPLAARQLYGSAVALATVVGFPLGYSSSAAKVFETREAVAAGAAEIDMVIQLGAALSGDLARVGAELREVVAAASGARVKVIIECCLLGDALKRALVEEVVQAGAAMVKTSTGFASGGATRADVELLVAAAAGRIGVKASGGIRDWASCRELLAAGASRIGTSAGVAIAAQWRAEQAL